MSKAKFTLFWLTGDREVIEGDDITSAVIMAGYGGGAIRALDFWANGDNEEYEWNGKTWRKKAIEELMR